MPVRGFRAAIAGRTLLMFAVTVISIGCSSAPPGQEGGEAGAGSLAELQTALLTGNPSSWYTEKLEQLDYEVKALRYERSDLLAYNVAKGSTAFHIEVTLDPETATASKIEIRPTTQQALAAFEESSTPHGEATAEGPALPATPPVGPRAADSPPVALPEEPEESPSESTVPGTEASATTELPAPAPTPEPDTVVALPAGTFVATRLNDSLDSGTAQVGDRFSMMVPEPVSIAGITALPAGSRIWGYVAEVQKARRPNGAGRLTLKADLIEVNGGSVEFEGLVTADGESLEGEDSVREDIKEIAVGAGVGGLVGGLLGGGKGVLAGVLIGGGGTFVATKGEEVRLPPDTALYVELREEVIVPVAR